MPMRTFSRWMPPVRSLSPAWKYSGAIVLSVVAISLQVKAYPFAPADALEDDLALDDEELEFAAESIARRCGRTLTEVAANPFYGRLKTVEDLVRFFYAQPRSIAV